MISIIISIVYHFRQLSSTANFYNSEFGIIIMRNYFDCGRKLCDVGANAFDGRTLASEKKSVKSQQTVVK